MTRAEHHNVVVVGSGSSGGVIASRLSENPDCRVLMLEAGPDFPEEATLPPLFAVSGGHRATPTGIPELDWNYATLEPNTGRRLRLARGKLVGGSSMVNGAIAVRGTPADYDHWAALGNPGWAWKDLLPYFTKLEADAEFGDKPYHGSSGPIHIRRYWREYWSPIDHAFFEGCLELGLRYAPDLNAPESGAGVVGPWPANRLYELRLGTLTTYIRLARPRSNFAISDLSLADRVLIGNGRARGVSYVRDGERREAHADLVILSAGAYGSPLILQRSGIGPRAWLERHGIRQALELPVGEHLLDHPNYAVEFRSEELAKTIGRLFLLNARGPLGAGGEPEWQLTPIPLDEAGGRSSVRLFLNRQNAAGYIRLASVDPHAHPEIEHRYNLDQNDLDRFKRGWEFCTALVADTVAFRHGKVEFTPARVSLTEVMAASVATSQHPAGTCKMGPAGDPTAVVDHKLAVQGIDGLMVADASVFPDMIMNNINLTCYAIGEKAADLALANLGASAATAVPQLQAD